VLEKMGSAQAVALNPPGVTSAGVEHAFVYLGDQHAVITCEGDAHFYTGAGSALSTATLSGIGSYLEIEAIGAGNWLVTKATAGVAFA
jgi:hypothetical protein